MRIKASEKLHNFTYYHNYIDLVRMELQGLRIVAPDEPLVKFAVLGSGPLPMTGLCIINAPQYQNGGSICVHNIDRDPEAISVSSMLCGTLGYAEETMRFHCSDARSDILELHDFDVVYLAALTGTCCDEKHGMVRNVANRMRTGALLVLRTAHSLRGLMYPVSVFV